MNAAQQPPLTDASPKVLLCWTREVDGTGETSLRSAARGATGCLLGTRAENEELCSGVAARRATSGADRFRMGNCDLLYLFKV